MLPREFQQVEYLESNRTQGIDTGVLVTDNYLRVQSKLKCTIQTTAGDSSKARFFGSQKNPYASIVPWSTTANRPFATIGVGSSFNINSPVVSYLNTVYEIDLTADNGRVYGEYCGGTLSTTYNGTVATGYTEGLFFNHHSNDYTGATGNYGASAIYYHKIYTSSGLVRDYIPCYRKADRKPGMYDLISKTFFTNIGTGEFTVGPEIR